MRYYFAPMEGVTDCEFRILHERYFPGADRYCLPFLTPTREHILTPRQLRELSPDGKARKNWLPQLLTASAEDFLWAAERLFALGFNEVNLNLGCPSGTVVSKGKGAGMLREPDALDAFLETVFSRCTGNISVKTRIGLEQPEEFGRLLEIFLRYPICELTVHPRTRRQLYKGAVRREAFDRAYRLWQGKLCYNGDLFSPADLDALAQRYPKLNAVMLGRGLLADPGLLCKYRGGSVTRERLREFHEELCRAYLARLHPNQAVLPKMKELWYYLSRSFDGGDAAFKKLRKARYWSGFYDLTRWVFDTLPLLDIADCEDL